MDIRQLRYFYTVAEEGQITRAAKKLNMAQPPLSQQLKLLEQELGVKLIERTGRKIELTEAGQVLFKRAENILNKVSETIMEVKEIGEGLRGTLSIGAVKSCLSYLPDKISSFNERFPLVTFRLWGGDPYYLCEHLKNRNIEIGIIRLIPSETLISFNLIRLDMEPFVFIIPKQWDHNPLKTTVEMKEIADYPLLMWHRTTGSGVYEMIMKECRLFGFTPKILCEGADVTMLLSLVAAGIGATILPKSAVFSYPDTNLKTMDIIDCSLRSEIAVIWLKDRYLSSIARRFIENF
jgi:DNA-binding transcriptional LysR family regulator